MVSIDVRIKYLGIILRNLSTIGHRVLLNPYMTVRHRDSKQIKHAKFEGAMDIAQLVPLASVSLKIDDWGYSYL